MKKSKTTYSAFTLVELIVSITIFTIMMVSVAAIFLFSSQMSTRVELNRMMQENIKNVVEDIAESVRTGNVDGVVVLWWASDCSGNTSSGASIRGFKLCMNTNNNIPSYEYALWYKHDDITWWLPINDINQCELINDTNITTIQNCRIIKRYNSSSAYFPLTNSFIDFQNVEFQVLNTDVPMVKMVFTMRPSYRKWILRNIIENNIVTVQTTVSERFISTQ